MSELLIGIDTGTSSTKGSLSNPDSDWSTISETVEPREENREIYDELYPATREAAHSLADLQKGGGDVVA